jgi:hypothetical protein
MRGEKYVGATEGEIIFLRLETDRGHFSLTGTEVSRRGETYDQVEESVENEVNNGDYDYLHEREGVAPGKDTEGFRSSLIPELVDAQTDGAYWYGDDGLYYYIHGGGQIHGVVHPNDFKVLARGVSKADLSRIWRAWRSYQLEPIGKVPKRELESLEAIFARLREGPTEEELELIRVE